MGESSSISDHWSVIKNLFLYVLIPVFAAMVVILGLAKAVDVPVTDLLRDTTAVLDGEFYVGLFSTTGIALWASAGAICILLLSSRAPESPRDLLIAGAVVSLMLAADDAYLIHETVGAFVGIPDVFIFTLYGIVAIALFWRSRKYLASRPNVSVFVAAVLLLGLSLGLDVSGELGPWTLPYSSVIEDVAKFLGIVSWLTFFGGLGRALIMSSEVAESSKI